MSDFSNSDQTLESYKIIFESSLDAILLTHPDGTIFYANSAAEELYGYTQQEICNLGRIGIVDTNDPNLQVIMDERARLGKSKGELTLIKKDGSKFPAEISTSLFKDENGNANTFTKIRDITHRKQNEKQIEYHALLLSKVNDAVIGADSNFIITYWNNGAGLMFGFTGKEAIGKSSVELLRPIYAPGEREIIINELKNKGTSKSTISTKHRNGTEIIVEVNSSRILNEQKDISGYVVVYRDITERKQVEKRTKELLESEQQLVEELQTSNEELQSVTEELHVSNEELQHQGAGLVKINQALLESEKRMDRSQEIAHLGSWELDLLKNQLFWSDEVYRIFGLKPQEFDATYEAFLEAIHPDDREAVDEAYNGSLREGIDTYEIEYRVVRRSTCEIRIVHEKCEHFRDSSGRIVRSLGMVHDITERKKVEESLNQSQKLLQDIINSFPSPIFVKDVEGRFLTINKKLEEQLGVKTEELKGKTDYDIITKELAEEYRINDQKVLQEGKMISIEEEADLIDGHHTFIANKFPIYDNNGKPYGVGSVSTDISELKKTEEILRESEERLRLSQTLGNVGIWDWNTITDELHFTPELEQLYGLIPGTIKTYQDWRQLTHPDDIEKIEAKRDEKIANHKPFDLEFRILHKSGQIHWLSAKGGAIYNDEGDILRVLGINTDITHRKKVEESLKESEERYHSLFDNNHAVMLLINPDNGNIIDANPAATHFYGYNYDELVKMNINNINVLCEEEIHDKMQKSVSFQKNNFLFKHQLASGEIRDVDVYSGKIVLGGEKLLYSIIHDVTDRMILQDKLKESNEDLERFAYVSSHDLQEPLRMVTSFTQLLERRYKGRLDEDADDYIGFIVDGAKRMKLLIDDLLMFSRLNTQPKENELVNLETVLDTVLLNLQVSIVENNVEITHDPLPSIYGDLSRKVQVFQNLISNAIKFNDKKIIKIHISAKKEGNERIFSVSDNGIGMDPKHLERIFIIFQRLHTREEYEGTGIGLAIIQKIIQQQNGRIWVESELGKGSTFYFTIPIN
jgi:PAS domain S-box-containing protein